MPESAASNDNTCELSNYGIQQDVVDTLFRSIVWWLEGKDLPWKQTRYINVFEGPQNRTVVELLFFHYDGPPEREVGGGGEYNHCKVYLYDDHVSVNFTGEKEGAYCGINFKYSTKWTATDKGLLAYLISYLNGHLNTIFENEPSRFAGVDTEVEAIKAVVAIAEGVIRGDIIA